MKISKEEVLHVANLAHLEFDEAEIDRFSEQVGKILEYVDALNQVDTTGIQPTSHAIFLTNAFREDVPKAHLDRQVGLANAPEQEDGCFLTPRVIG
ncbi:MAG: Asp-tRNA(Asn)/Glu-tRNA(Gln) amidotransferase subunit GatC [Desulfobacterales bacterium]|jgi:aspartyl/glutamyl-tRNA(Asn/Gln) amidotransferase, C subunit|nr:Asp-tRNA(Asn)/Glu-tRNA(Gln) amidotransferase subunit GatC [Desulfobacterales bacterium]MDD3082561.1 Asp-tRNA(Asn)/Glu-tRNA(Gln) amidotransferase subunit GatC [Desulfobacterales bacterium]MDD3951604.1 Asp-tRNA(Asn)/Glu-tRNA(Gln) amidotransferase subunit GatC [Desulfobacterales bacterium]MDD4462931.1 Asp-tRNA(Asn)/Glu-tRNA(Gln) amidotransferase subunit GatC [Desulfobacterales bacterium]